MSQNVVYLFILSLFVPRMALSNDHLQKERIVIGRFSSGELTGWEERVFDNETTYFFTKVDDQVVLKSVSNDSASGLFKEVSVDIQKYPYLNWRWRVEGRLLPLAETKKTGDDYSARLYVIVSGGLFFWKTKAINYVWSSRSKTNDRWPNAFSPDNNQMVAVRTAEDQVGIWYSEKRNVYEELKSWLGNDVHRIDAIAIMTDTDNSDTRATAFYGDIYFSKE